MFYVSCQTDRLGVRAGPLVIRNGDIARVVNSWLMNTFLSFKVYQL